MFTRILVIADDEPACQFLQATLRGAKITVDVCTHPMAVLNKNLPAYDLLLADIGVTRLTPFVQIREALPQNPWFC